MAIPGLMAAIAIGASAAPTLTTRQEATTTVELTGVTHSVVAGLAGQLVFDPDNVVAQVGDIVDKSHYCLLQTSQRAVLAVLGVSRTLPGSIHSYNQTPLRGVTT